MSSIFKILAFDWRLNIERARGTAEISEKKGEWKEIEDGACSYVVKNRKWRILCRANTRLSAFKFSLVWSVLVLAYLGIV